MGDYNSPADIEWNMSQGYYAHVLKIIAVMDDASSIDSPELWYKYARMLYRKVSNRFEKEVAQKLNEEFQEIAELLNKIASSNPKSKGGQVERQQNYIKALEKLDSLEINLIGAMAEKGLLPKDIQRLPPGQAVRGMFGRHK